MKLVTTYTATDIKFHKPDLSTDQYYYLIAQDAHGVLRPFMLDAGLLSMAYEYENDLIARDLSGDTLVTLTPSEVVSLYEQLDLDPTKITEYAPVTVVSSTPARPPYIPIYSLCHFEDVDHSEQDSVIFITPEHTNMYTVSLEMIQDCFNCGCSLEYLVVHPETNAPLALISLTAAELEQILNDRQENDDSDQESF